MLVSTAVSYAPGYFAFPPTPQPPPGRLEGRTPFTSTENLESANAPPSVAHETRPTDEEVRVRLKEQQRRAAEEEKRRKRLERESHEVYLSELAWVRSGGILRDAQGRRDRVRTAKMQEEIRLQDEEKRIMDRWDAYETRWRGLNASNDSLAWEDIPWPTVAPPTSPADLTPEAVSEFIFATFRVRGVNGIRKERIRSSILRWHPDKLLGVVTKTVDEERHVVQDGINTVFGALKQIQDQEKQMT